MYSGSLSGCTAGSVRNTYLALRTVLLNGGIFYALTPHDLCRGKHFAFFINGRFSGVIRKAPDLGDLTGMLDFPVDADRAEVWVEEVGPWTAFGQTVPDLQAKANIQVRGSQFEIASGAPLYVAGNPDGDTQLSNIVVTGAVRGVNVAPVEDLPQRGELTYTITTTGGVHTLSFWNGLVLVASVDFTVDGAFTALPVNGSGLTVDGAVTYSADVAMDVARFELHWPKRQGIYYGTSELFFPAADEVFRVASNADNHTITIGAAPAEAPVPGDTIKLVSEPVAQTILTWNPGTLTMTVTPVLTAAIGGGVDQALMHPAPTLWSGVVNYSAGALVLYANVSYLSINGVLSSTPPPSDPTNWLALGQWRTLPRDYANDDGQQNAFTYRTPPLTSGTYNWVSVPENEAGVAAAVLTWSSATTYVPGNIVKRSGVMYVAINTSTNHAPETHASDWTPLQFTITAFPLAPTITGIAAGKVNWTNNTPGTTVKLFTSLCNGPVNFGQNLLPAPVGPSAVNAVQATLPALSVPAIDYTTAFDDLADVYDDAVAALNPAYADAGTDDTPVQPVGWTLNAGISAGDSTFTRNTGGHPGTILVGEQFAFHDHATEFYFVTAFNSGTGVVTFAPVALHNEAGGVVVDFPLARTPAWHNGFDAVLATQAAAIAAGLVAFALGTAKRVADFQAAFAAALALLQTAVDGQIVPVGWTTNATAAIDDTSVAITGGTGTFSANRYFQFQLDPQIYNVVSFDGVTLNFMPPLKDALIVGVQVAPIGPTSASEWQAQLAAAYAAFILFVGYQLEGDGLRYTLPDGTLPGSALPETLSINDLVTPRVPVNYLRVALRATLAGVEEHDDIVWVQEIDSGGTPLALRPNNPQLLNIAPVVVTGGVGIHVDYGVDESNRVVAAKGMAVSIVPDDGTPFDWTASTTDFTATVALGVIREGKTLGPYAAGWWRVGIRTYANGGVLSAAWVERRFEMMTGAPVPAWVLSGAVV